MGSEATDKAFWAVVGILMLLGLVVVPTYILVSGEGAAAPIPPSRGAARRPSPDERRESPPPRPPRARSTGT